MVMMRKYLRVLALMMAFELGSVWLVWMLLAFVLDSLLLVLMSGLPKWVWKMLAFELDFVWLALQLVSELGLLKVMWLAYGWED